MVMITVVQWYFTLSSYHAGRVGIRLQLSLTLVTVVRVNRLKCTATVTLAIIRSGGESGRAVIRRGGNLKCVPLKFDYKLDTD
eukprot:g45724.t1